MIVRLATHADRLPKSSQRRSCLLAEPKDTAKSLDEAISVQPLVNSRGAGLAYDFFRFLRRPHIALRTYGKILPFSRQMVVNDNIGAIKSIVANGGAAAARTEARLVAEALESNNPMADGGLPFHATYVNIQAAPLDHSTLGQAVAKLRLQATPEGNRADFSAAHLVVAADIEYAARKLVHESGASIAVSSLANLPDGRWYLLASPEVAQTITVGTLKGSARPITVEQRAVSAFENDSTAIRIRADLAAALQSRVGIIRGGV